jgi:hypothetical protein
MYIRSRGHLDPAPAACTGAGELLALIVKSSVDLDDQNNPPLGF